MVKNNNHKTKQQLSDTIHDNHATDAKVAILEPIFQITVTKQTYDQQVTTYMHLLMFIFPPQVSQLVQTFLFWNPCVSNFYLFIFML